MPTSIMRLALTLVSQILANAKNSEIKHKKYSSFKTKIIFSQF